VLVAAARRAGMCASIGRIIAGGGPEGGRDNQVPRRAAVVSPDAEERLFGAAWSCSLIDAFILSDMIVYKLIMIAIFVGFHA